MAGRLVALDKYPGIRPIGIGETWRRLAAKATLLASGKHAKELCGIDQLCAGLEAGIEGIHAIDELWKQHKEQEEWGFLLFDASNAFNELNWMAMPWTIQHEWPSGVRFAFNCYRHWATIHGKEGTIVLIFSKEGVTRNTGQPPLHVWLRYRHLAADPKTEDGIPWSEAALVRQWYRRRGLFC
jgi:hypothetical protein